MTGELGAVSSDERGRCRDELKVENELTVGGRLGQRTFGEADQRRFARLSGDVNPMHMDALAARRTQAGAPVVHGVHTALVALEFLAEAMPAAGAIAAVKATFSKMTYVGDCVTYRLGAASEKNAAVDALVDGVMVARVIATFGGMRAANFAVEAEPGGALRVDAPLDLTLAQMEGRTGCVGVPATPDAVTAAFPGACRLWSAERILAVLTTTTLVGMQCPGLHSIFGGFTLNASEALGPEDGLAYRVSLVDPRFRMVRLQVWGLGVWGTIDSFARVPPVAQPGPAALAGKVAADEFAGSTALVVGGSRGLGELTAKLLAAGGAKVIVTYATGVADAQAVASSIRAAGGDCAVGQYDFRLAAEAQLAALPGGITHFYYFATPQIFRRKAGLFVAERYADFVACYVTAFYDLFARLHAAAGGLAAFYPSSTALDERPQDMTEYTMAKAAGEVLCADIDAWLPKARVVVARLPRLATDQTATVTQAETQDAVEVMLPLVRRVQAG